jgi:hypothetical protein
VHEIDRSLEDLHILVWYLEATSATLVSEDATCTETDHTFWPYHAALGESQCFRPTERIGNEKRIVTTDHVLALKDQFLPLCDGALAGTSDVIAQT